MSLYQLERDSDVDSLLDYATGSETDAVRERAVEILGELGADDQHVIDALIKRARTDDASAVRAAAIDALDALGPDAIEQLIAALAGIDRADDADWVKTGMFVNALDSGRPVLKMAAANALGRIGDPSTVEPLVARLSDDHAGVRARAARACGQIGNPVAVDPLVSVLPDRNIDVRREAAAALASIESPTATAALFELLEDDNEVIRHIAVTALGNARSTKAIDALIDSLADESVLVRRAAVFSLLELLSNIPTERSDAIRQTIVEKLTETDDEDVVNPLVDVIERSNQPAQRRNAVWLLGRVAGDASEPAVAEALAAELDAEDAMLAQFAATSLSNLGGDEVEQTLLDVVDDPAASLDARTRAVFTLGTVGGDDARARLDELIDETDADQLRAQAFKALSKLGGRA